MEAEGKLSLGAYLKSLREARILTLRDIEARTGISNAFLSQVESGKVRQPSPISLYKLAEVYGVPYEVLMERAGHPVPTVQEPAARSASAVLNRIGEISEEEEHELLEYLAFLRSRVRKGARRR